MTTSAARNESHPTSMNDVIPTSKSRKVIAFLNGTKKRSQFSVVFGGTGLGKSWAAEAWCTENPAIYVRVRSNSSQPRLRRQISQAIFQTENMTESAIIKYFLDNPGSVLILDEAVHLIGNSNYTGIVALDSVRDIYDEVSDAGGKLGIAMIFTEYNMERLRKCRIASFLLQFINRFDNHLNLGSSLSFAWDIKPIVEELIPEATPELFEYVKTFKDTRSLFKRIREAREYAKKHNEPLDLDLLREFQIQFETGEYPDERKK